MSYLDGGDVLRLISSMLIVADKCNNLHITFKKVEFVKSIGLGSLGLVGSILYGLVGNFAYDQENRGSAGMWTITSAVFRHPLCLKLIIVALVIWLGFNGFFVTVHDNRKAGRSAPQRIGPLDPQHVRSSNPPITNDPDLLGLMDYVRNEIVTTRDEMRALDERLFLLQELVQNILPSAIVCSSQPDLSLTAHTKDPVPDLEAAMGSTVTVHGSKILHRRFEIESPADFELDNAGLRAKLEALRLQIIETMRLARIIDKDCTFQLGSFAVLKYTDTGFKWWKLQRHSVPEILHICRSPWKLSNLLAGCPPTWTIRGCNLQNATLKAACADRSETLKVLHSEKMENGEDLFFCEEPRLLQNPSAMFKEQIYIYASTNFLEVEEGTTIRLQSEPINARKAYGISVLQGLVPSPWTMIIIGSLSLLTTLGSTPFGKQVLPHVEKLLTLQHGGNIILRGPNSSLLRFWMVLYNSFEVYIFAIFIPNLFSTLWLLSRDCIWPLGDDRLSPQRTPNSHDLNINLYSLLPLPHEEGSVKVDASLAEEEKLEGFDDRRPGDAAFSSDNSNATSNSSASLSDEHKLKSTDVTIEELKAGGDYVPSLQTCVPFEDLRNPLSSTLLLLEEDKSMNADLNNEEEQEEEGEDTPSPKTATAHDVVDDNGSILTPLQLHKADANVDDKKREEDKSASADTVTTAVADSDKTSSVKGTPAAMIESETDRKRWNIGEPGVNIPVQPRTNPLENCSNVPSLTSPWVDKYNVNIEEKDQKEAMEETEKVTIGKEEGWLAEHKQAEENNVPSLQLCVPFEDLSKPGNPASLLPGDESMNTNSSCGEEQEQENEISLVQSTNESSRCVSSFSSYCSSKTRTVAIAVEAHRRYQIEPFMYAITNLVEQKVVVISCLSRLQDELGLDHPIDVDSFGGVKKKKLEAEVKTQIITLNHFLRDFRDKLNRRGVELDIWVSVGPKSQDILVQAATALHPHWLVLDRSFFRHKKKIQAALQCNLVLMGKKGTLPEILQVSPDDQILDKDYEEEPELSSRRRSFSRSSNSSSKASPITKLKSFFRFQDTAQEAISISTVIAGFTDGGSGADESDDRRKDQSVLNAERALGYFEKQGHDRTMTQAVPILLSSRSIGASPTVSRTQSTWLNFKSRLTTRRSNEKSTQLLHHEVIDSQKDFSTPSSGSRTPMVESKENVIFRMTPTGKVEYTSIGDSEAVKKHGNGVPSPRANAPREAL